MLTPRFDADRLGVRGTASRIEFAVTMAATVPLHLQAISPIGVQAEDHPSRQRGNALGGNEDRNKPCSQQTISPKLKEEPRQLCGSR